MVDYRDDPEYVTEGVCHGMSLRGCSRYSCDFVIDRASSLCAGGTWTRDAEGRQTGKVLPVNVQVQSLKGTLVSLRGCIGYDLLMFKVQTTSKC